MKMSQKSHSIIDFVEISINCYLLYIQDAITMPKPKTSSGEKKFSFHVIKSSGQISLNRINRCPVITDKYQHNQQAWNHHTEPKSGAADISEHFMPISHNKGINQKQSNHKCNHTRSKEIVKALPAYHLYNVLPVYPNLI